MSKKTSRASRLPDLVAFDAAFLAESVALHQRPYAAVLGVDEVGRGSIVGSVIAAAAVFPVSALTNAQQAALFDLDDSKAPHLNHAKRLAMAEQLQQFCFWGLGEASQAEVESINVVQASLLASHRAILDLGQRFPQCNVEEHLVVVDGKMRLPHWPHGQRPCVKADALSASVAAASIIAKAHRDAMLMDLADDYPGYGWHTNAGYPTPPHKAALATLGVTPLHRKTYQAVREAVEQAQLKLPV